MHECPSQGEVDNILSDELKLVTYEGDWVAKHFCPARAEMVEQIIGRLRKADVWKCSTPKTLNISEMRDWPGEASAGPAFCGPFTTLLNTIVEAFAACCPSEFKRSYNRDVIFKQYTETVQEAGEYVLRPSILALSKVLLNKGRASWYATVFAGEVNCCWGRLVLQAGAYARCLFAASDHRVFIPIMALHQSTSTFRLLFYHRSGVLASHAMALYTVSGFNDFVSTIVGMWLWQEPSQAGYVPTQLPRYHSFNGIKFFVHCILCRRQAIRGRATTVYLVDCEELPEDLARYHAVPQVECGSREWECLNPFDYHDQQPEGLAELEDDNDEEGGEADVEAESQEDTVTTQELVLTDPLPEYFIVKCSHQPLGQTTELEVFRDVQGFIGIPDIIAEYDALCFVIPADKTPSPWKVFIAREEDILPYEPRVHKHTVIASIGHRLTADLTFKQVGYALLHAMIGHCALFTEGGYLHRDISNGNIVRLVQSPRSDWKIPPLLHGVVTSNECSAVLIDGDVAKEWGSPAQASDRSGTLPFISAGLADAWEKKQAILHTPIDDLESFAWVLLYDALAWTPASERTTAEDNFKMRLLLESAWRSRVGNEGNLSPILDAFERLIHAWFLKSTEFAAAHKQLLREQRDETEFTRLYHDAYKAFISVGLEQCAALPDTPIKSVYEE
ncbi:hypothetical protein EYR38_001864 [Pleurotus pulmonarius]|nr:hypothetical protein EYR38_001864 [Pleurotus pulmonarius]